MFLQAAYQQLQLTTTSKQLVEQCYEVTNDLPEEKNNLTQHIRQSVVSMYLCLCEASYQSKKQRRKAYRTAIKHLMVADAAFDIGIALGYMKEDQLKEISGLFLYIYEQLNKLTDEK